MLKFLIVFIILIGGLAAAYFLWFKPKQEKAAEEKKKEDEVKRVALKEQFEIECRADLYPVYEQKWKDAQTNPFVEWTGDVPQDVLDACVEEKLRAEGL